MQGKNLESENISYFIKYKLILILPKTSHKRAAAVISLYLI